MNDGELVTAVMAGILKTFKARVKNATLSGNQLILTEAHANIYMI